MTPKFALSLSYDGIRLAYRASDGWRSVGDVRFDAADLPSALADLRARADDIEPGNVACKLIIPDDQIRYLSIPTDENDPDGATRGALDGATPYAVDDLAYDASVDGAQTHIAAVAKETLAEAHAFAQEHAFNPVSAVASPDQDVFSGEPFFGATKAGVEIARHDDLVAVIGEYIAPTPAAEVVQDGETSTTPDATQETAAQISPQQADEALTPEEAKDAPQSRAEVGFASRRGPAGKAPTLAGALRAEIPAAKVTARAPDSGMSTSVSLTVNPPRSAKAPPLEADVTAPTIALEGDTDAFDEAPEKPAPEPKTTLRFLSRRKPAKFSEPAAATAPASEAHRMTVFGARPAAPPVVGGKPRFLGLILTAALLVFLAGVAAWATVFMDDGLARFFGARPDTRTVSVPEAVIPDAPLTEDTPVVTASLEPELSPEDSAVLGALQDPLPDPVATQPDFSFAELEARYAVTGIWPVAPDIPEPAGLVPLEDLYLTSIDPLSPAQDAVALPDARTLDTDQNLRAVLAPPAAGTRYALDDRGWVIPTPEGAVSPENVTVYLGKPPSVPPPRPERAEPVPEVDTATAALAAFRPKSRPTDLIENSERSNLGGVTLSELAGSRPKLRPNVVRTVEEQAIEGALEEALEAPDPEVVENPLATATRLAVAASTRPDTRPRNFARIVERARKRQAEQPAQETTRVAAVAPRTVTPKIPSSASVSKEATVRNAINLGRVNLIGVTGKPSNRRALVRLANGRMKPVKVGDKIDGGRVTAIGESELRYQKGSRNLVLKMPNG